MNFKPGNIVAARHVNSPSHGSWTQDWVGRRAYVRKVSPDGIGLYLWWFDFHNDVPEEVLTYNSQKHGFDIIEEQAPALYRLVLNV